MPPEPTGPVICAEFERLGIAWQVVEWPDDDDVRFDVVRADLPYIWRERQTFSEEFGA